MAVEDADIPIEGITQGEFAMWLVKAAGIQGRLPPAALQQDAINLLYNLGFNPHEGWDKDKKLTQDDLIDILGISMKEAEGKSWEDIIKLLVQAVRDIVQQINAIAGASGSPSVSPSSISNNSNSVGTASSTSSPAPEPGGEPGGGPG